MSTGVGAMQCRDREESYRIITTALPTYIATKNNYDDSTSLPKRSITP